MEEYDLPLAGPWRDEYFCGFPGWPLADRGRLPIARGLYFAFAEPHKMLYIGKSKDFRSRWQGHHRIRDLQRCGDVWIHVLRVDRQVGDYDLSCLERWCIARFKPRFNYTPTANIWRDRFSALFVHARRLEAQNQRLRALLEQLA